MTALGLILFAAGVALLWGAVTGRDPLNELRIALTGKGAKKKGTS